MITRADINLSSDYAGGDAFAVDDGLLTVQMDYANLDGDVDVIPMQTNESSGADYGPIMDEKGHPIVLRIRKHNSAKHTYSGTQFLNLSEIRCLTAKILIKNKDNTTGTATLTIKNSITES